VGHEGLVEVSGAADCWAGRVGGCIAYYNLTWHILYRGGLVLCIVCKSIHFGEEFSVAGDSFFGAK
jgi:hypothetical protein